jgi:hypothetical protein
MISRLPHWHSFVSVLLLGLTATGSARAKLEAADSEFVRRALAAELANVQDPLHPMRYRLRKSSPRLSTTKQILETKDGAIARLIAINDKPLSAADEQKEQDRLSALLSDPSQQSHRKQAQGEDTKRVLKVLRALPNAFLYEYAGEGQGPQGKVEKFAFTPNPGFEPPDLESHALTEMIGEIWIDAAQSRVVRLEGRLRQDVDFGWGILGRLDKGGWIVIEQANVDDHQWRVVHFQMVMSGRVLFKARSFDTVEDESGFAPLPVGLRYAEAIRMIRSSSLQVEPSTR